VTIEGFHFGRSDAAGFVLPSTLNPKP